MSKEKVQLVIQTAFLGDLILSLPFLSAIKRRHSDQQLWLVCRAGTGAFISKLNIVDRVIEVKKGQADSYSAALAQISEVPVDTLWCPHQSFRSAFFSFRIKADRKIGFANSYSTFFFDHKVKRDASLPDALRQLSLLQVFDPTIKAAIAEYKAAGIAISKTSDSKLSVAPEWACLNLKQQVLSDQISYQAMLKRFQPEHVERLAKAKNLVLLFPGSVWATKKWSEQGFIDVGCKYAEAGSGIAENLVLVMGGPGEEEICQRIANGIESAINLAGVTSIYESLMIIARAKLVVANDSASSHLACLVDTALVTCFGPTVLSFGYRPWGRRVWIAELEALQCRPCGKHGHNKCPRKTHECMVNLSSLEVSRLAAKAYSSV